MLLLIEPNFEMFFDLLAFLGVKVRICVGSDIPMSVGIVEPKTHPSQLNAAEFLWDMKKRTSVFVQVSHTSSSLCSRLCLVLLLTVHGSNRTYLYNSCTYFATSLLVQTVVSETPVASADTFRCTASAQSSLPGSTAERRACPSGSRLTPSSRETLESTQNTSTLPPAKSKSLRSLRVHSWVEVEVVMVVFSTLFFILNLSVNPPLLSPFSQKGPIASKRRTERRWRNAQPKRRKSTSLLTIPLSFQRSVGCHRVKPKLCLCSPSFSSQMSLSPKLQS